MQKLWKKTFGQYISRTLLRVGDAGIGEPVSILKINSRGLNFTNYILNGLYECKCELFHFTDVDLTDDWAEYCDIGK